MDPPKGPINDLEPELLLRILLFSCQGNPKSFSQLLQVSQHWNGLLTFWKPHLELFNHPDSFKNANLAETGSLIPHIHFANVDDQRLEAPKYQPFFTRMSIVCLEIWIGPDTIPLLTMSHPQLRQLTLSRPRTAKDGDGSGATSGDWIHNAPYLNNLCSLHLIKPYPELLKAFGDMSSPPPLVEFGTTIPSFQNHGCEALPASLSMFLNKLSPTLETFIFRCALLPAGTSQSPLVSLKNLKELQIRADDSAKPLCVFPLKLSTPNLETFIDNHFDHSGLYHTGVSTVISLGDWSPAWDLLTYSSVPNLQCLYLQDDAKLDAVREHLLSNTTLCPSLRLIEIFSPMVQERRETKLMRGTTTVVLIEVPFNDEGRILKERIWSCDGPYHAHDYQRDTENPPPFTD